MNGQFKYIFSPIKIGSVTLKNRLFFSAHNTAFGNVEGMPTDISAYYYAERAKGGVGLIIAGQDYPTLIDVANLPEMIRGIRVYDDRVIPGYKKIADMVHEYDSKIFVQYGANGCWFGGPGSVSSSAIEDLDTHVTAKELEIDEIKGIIDYYVKSAQNLAEAGVDGVEIHEHGGLVHQFISPLWNKREDDYGGSLRNRMRFLLEIIERVKEVIPKHMALGYRMSADELLPNGITVEDSKEIAKILEQTARIDFLDVDISIDPHNVHIVIAPMYVEPGYETYASVAIKAVVKIPVFTAGRINDPVFAEKILAEGKADMVAMTRAQIADPELVNKAREGRLDEIRPCLGDNEKCIGRLFSGQSISCTVNPAVGKEKEWGKGTLQAVSTKKKVLVVGGGVAGMECARIAALRGHQVTIREKQSRLGGQVNLAAKYPGREGLADIVRWFEFELKRVGVEILLGEEVTAEKVKAISPDVVVMATGATFIRDGFNPLNFSSIPGSEQENVFTIADILTNEDIPIGEKVLIVDVSGFMHGPGLAEFLAARGKRVEIISPDPCIGIHLIPNLQLPHVYPRIMEKGIVLTPNTFIKEICGNSLVIFNVHTFEEERREEIDTIVLQTGLRPNDGLYKGLKGNVKEIHRIGDCANPHSGLYGIGDAIYDGQRLGRML